MAGGSGAEKSGRTIITEKRNIRTKEAQRRAAEQSKENSGALTTPSKPFQHVATQSWGRLVSNGHSAPLSGKEYDPIWEAKGQLTQGQWGNDGTLNSR